MRMAWTMSVFILLSMITTWGWAFDADQNQKTISGTLVDIDSVKSMIAVRYADSLSGNMDEINIIVPSEAEIMNGTEKKYFSDLEQADLVTITYDDDGVSGLKAKRIADLNEGNRDL
jgi:hypothetical protein